MTNGERIRAIRTSLKLTMAAFGERIGKSKDAVKMYEYDKVKPDETTKRLICIEYNVNPLYLSGESEIIFMPPQDDAEMLAAALPNTDPATRALLLSIVQNPDGWDVFLRAVFALQRILGEIGITPEMLTDEKKPGP